MKKLFTILLCLALVFALSGCHLIPDDILGGQGGNNDTTDADEFDNGNITIDTAYAKAKALGYDGSLDDFIAMISGKDGADGKNGVDGADGKDGVGIVSVMLDNKGHLIVYLSNGTVTDCGKIMGEDGKDGVDGAPGKDGEDGKDGVDGAPGKDGATIAKVEFDDEGRLVITLTDGTVLEPVELPKEEEHVHTFGEWINYPGNDNISCEDRLFYHICTECKSIEWQSGSYEHHIFVTETIPATCTAGGYDIKTCSTCGKVEISNETSILDHEYSENYESNNSFHWKQCKGCENTSEYAEHTLGDNGICTVCDALIGATEGVIYDVSVDGTYAEVIGYSGNATRIRFADEYMGLPVRVIYEKAFHNNHNITSVVIPDSVTSIGSYAFYYCTSLTSVVIPDSVTSIGNYAFESCYNLTSVVIPDSVTSIGSEAFEYCRSLTSVEIPDSVTSIGNRAFSWCTSLTSVTLDNGCAASIDESAFSSCNSALYTEYEYGRYVGNSDNPYQILIGLTNKNFTSYTIHEDTQIIASSVFSSCERLTNITIPDSVTSIGDGAFSNCTNLTSVSIGNSVTSIGYQAFYGCDSLTSVVIPDSVTSIGYDAFYYCTSLKDVYYTGSEEDWAKISIDSSNYSLTYATKHYNYVSE